MVNQQMLDYIKQQVRQGTSKEQIKNILMSNGWDASDVEEGFNAVAPGSVPIPPPTTITPTMQSVQPSSSFINPVVNQQAFVNQKKPTPWGKIIFGILVVAILAGAGWYGYKYFFNPKVNSQAVIPSIVNQETNQTADQTPPTQTSPQNNPAPAVTQNTGPLNCGTVRDDAASYLLSGVPPGAQPTISEKTAIACMDNAIVSCSAGTIITTRTSQSTSFEVKGKENDNCVISIGNFTDKKITTCKIPLSLISEINQQALQQKQNLTIGIGFIMAFEIPIPGVKSTVTIPGHPGLKLDCTTI